MRKYYTRACNFYYGSAAKKLIYQKKALPLNSKKSIAFDKIEIFHREKNKTKSKILSISKIKNLNKKIRSQVKIDVPVYFSNKLPASLKSLTVTKPGSRYIK